VLTATVCTNAYVCRFIDDQLHQVETVGSDARRGMFGALHVLRAEPTYATALTETDGVAYTLESKELNKVSYTYTHALSTVLFQCGTHGCHKLHKFVQYSSCSALS
jgi:hypothetical protein